MNWFNVYFHESEEYFGISVFEDEDVVVFVVLSLEELGFARAHVEKVEPWIDGCQNERNDGSSCVDIWEG